MIVALLAGSCLAAACGNDVGNDIDATVVALDSGTGGSTGGVTTGATTSGDVEAGGGADAPPSADADVAALDADASAPDAAPMLDAMDERPLPDPTLPLGAKSAACLACAQANCQTVLSSCSHIAGNASVGRGAGSRLSDLCVETLSCVIDSGCAATELEVCYCGSEIDTCLSPLLQNGVCKTAIERSSEPSNYTAPELRNEIDPASVLSSLTDQTKAAGQASAVLRCLRDNRCTSCFVPDSDGAADGSTPLDAAQDGRTGD